MDVSHARKSRNRPFESDLPVYTVYLLVPLGCVCVASATQLAEQIETNAFLSCRETVWFNHQWGKTVNSRIGLSVTGRL